MRFVSKSGQAALASRDTCQLPAASRGRRLDTAPANNNTPRAQDCARRWHRAQSATLYAITSAARLASQFHQLHSSGAFARLPANNKPGASQRHHGPFVASAAPRPCQCLAALGPTTARAPVTRPTQGSSRPDSANLGSRACWLVSARRPEVGRQAVAPPSVTIGLLLADPARRVPCGSRSDRSGAFDLVSRLLYLGSPPASYLSWSNS